jgi:hypothetical protein
MSARTWKSVYDIPFDVLFRGLPEGAITWRRFTGDTVMVADSIAWIEDPRKLDAKFPDGFAEVIALPAESGDTSA